MNTNDNCWSATFKWLATVLSFAVTLPGYFNNNSKMAFILTACVLVFGKLVENIEGIIYHKAIFHTFFCVVGSLVGVFAVGLCFYYFAAMSNVTQIIGIPDIKTSAVVEDKGHTINDDLDNDSKMVVANEEDMSGYPLVNEESFYVLLFFSLIYFIAQETIFCGCEFCKYINTKKRILLGTKKSNQLLDVPIELGGD